MENQPPPTNLEERFLCRLSWAWGFAEATLFFIVPDVLLSFVALRNFSLALKLTLYSVIGAVFGGVLVYLCSAYAPESTVNLLTHVPLIDPAMIGRVESQLKEHGVLAVLFGPSLGIPYKIYAAEAGALGISLLLFILISIPARLIRFVLVCGLAYLFNSLLPTEVRVTRRYKILTSIWIVFYGFYALSFS